MEHLALPHRIIPLLIPAKSSTTVCNVDAWHSIQQLEMDVLEAQDNLLRAKISQSTHANRNHILKFPFVIGSHVQLSTLHCVRGQDSISVVWYFLFNNFSSLAHHGHNSHT